jgi:hypothetical protein
LANAACVDGRNTHTVGREETLLSESRQATWELRVRELRVRELRAMVRYFGLAPRTIVVRLGVGHTLFCVEHGVVVETVFRERRVPPLCRTQRRGRVALPADRPLDHLVNELPTGTVNERGSTRDRECVRQHGRDVNHTSVQQLPTERANA